MSDGENRLTGIEKLKRKNWNPRTQTKIVNLTIRDVVYWENPFFSVGLIATLNILYLLVTHYDYTMLGLLCMLLSVNISCFCLYRFILSLTGKEGWKIRKVSIEVDDIEPFVEASVGFLNHCLSRYTDLIRAVSYKKSMMATFALFTISRIFTYFEDLTLIILFVNGALLIPFLLDTFDMEIGRVVEKAKKHHGEMVSKIKKKYKKAKPHLEKAVKKGKEVVDDARKKGGELYEQGKVKGGELYEQGKVKAEELYEQGKEKAEVLVEKGQEIYEDAKVRGEGLYQRGKEEGGKLVEKGQELLEQGIEKGKEIVDDYTKKDN